MLFERFSSRLLRFLTNMVGPTQAKDLTQITFLKVHENRHRYRVGASVASWIFTIARNSASGDDAQKVHARRLAISKLGDNQVIKRLFEEIAPRFANRNGGYTRILKLGPRMGDSAEMVILELVEE